MYDSEEQYPLEDDAPDPEWLAWAEGVDRQLRAEWLSLTPEQQDAIIEANEEELAARYDARGGW
jgi:hypothetical protein